MNQINEGDSKRITLQCYDYDNNKVNPETITYKVIDTDSGTILVPETVLTPNVGLVQFDIPCRVNTIIGDKNTEERKVTIKWSYNNGNDGKTSTLFYLIKKVD